MLCPVCNVDLLIADRQGIEIDYCPKCRGVWLDRGELDKLIDRSSAMAAPRGGRGEAHVQYAPPHHEKQHESQGEYKHKSKHKRRSFLEDMFDFD